MQHHEGATAMADDGQTPYLYVQETAYFGFYPLRFTDRLIDHANDTIYTTAERFRTLLDSSSGSTLISPWQMEEAMLKLLTLLESAIDKNFDIFELYCLKNILKFPASLRAFNEMQPESFTTDDEFSEAALLRKRQELKSAKLFHFKLKYERSRLLIVYAKCRALMAHFATLKRDFHLDPNFPLVDSIRNIESQMKMLKELVALTLDKSNVLLKLTTDFKLHQSSIGQGLLVDAAKDNVQSQVLNQESVADELASMRKISSLEHLSIFNKNLQSV